MSRQTLLLRYIAFVVIAMTANLTAQRAVLFLNESSFRLPLAIATGTMVGLVIKYSLDHRWIYDDVSPGYRSHGRKFTLYTALGLITTMIFWGTESMFFLIWRSDQMRELGAVLGLSVGYWIKFHLDRRLVFINARSIKEGTT